LRGNPLKNIVEASMKSPDPIACDFIRFCIQRHGAEWPALYDEICWVAGHRLFKGLGYDELRGLGISLSLNNIENTLKLVDAVAAEKQEVHYSTGLSHSS